MKEWVKHQVATMIVAVVTAVATAISAKWHLGLTPDQTFQLGLTVTGAFGLHGAAKTHAEDSK